MSVNLSIEQSLWAQGYEHIAGVDEAGRGPLAGPLVAAAVIFPKDAFIEDVDDSKKLSAKKREEVYSLIVSKAISISIGMVDHIEIDRINILQATIQAMQKALEGLCISPHFAIIDGNYFLYDKLPFKTIVDGDAKSFTIAAASIVAKVTRDRLMFELDERYPQYGFARHKGYGTKRHIEALHKFGPCEIHRKSFHLPSLKIESKI